MMLEEAQEMETKAERNSQLDMSKHLATQMTNDSVIAISKTVSASGSTNSLNSIFS